MNKKEILEKSRQENKNKDMYEKEVIKESWNYGATSALVLATVFFVIQIFTGGGINYGIYAVVFSMPATVFVLKYYRLRMKHELFVAIIYILITLFFSFAHIYKLISSSTIL